MNYNDRDTIEYLCETAYVIWTQVELNSFDIWDIFLQYWLEFNWDIDEMLDIYEHIYETRNKEVWYLQYLHDSHLPTLIWNYCLSKTDRYFNINTGDFEIKVISKDKSKYLLITPQNYCDTLSKQDCIHYERLIGASKKMKRARELYFLIKNNDFTKEEVEYFTHNIEKFYIT